MQIRHDLQIGHDCAQLGSRAQIQTRPLIDVKWLVDAIGLHPHQVRTVASFEQRKAVGDLRWIVLGGQHLESVQSRGLSALSGGCAGQPLRNSLLDGVIERTCRLQIESIEFVEARHAERSQ